MSLSAKDFVGDPCGCPECHQAGVSDRPTRRDPHTGRWLHGQALWRWYEAKEQLERAARQAVGPRGRREQMERLIGDASAEA